MSNLNGQNIQGAGGGGKGGGGGGRAAVEDPNSLRSKQYATVVDVISEGEIGGLVNGLKSVYLNDTPVENPDGSTNFKGVTYFASNGGPSMGAMYGSKEAYFKSGGVRATSAVNLEVKKDLAITRTIVNSEVDWAEVTIGVPQLTTQDKNTGDIHGGSVSIAIDVQSNGGGFVPQTLSTRWHELTLISPHLYRSGNDATGVRLTLNMGLVVGMKQAGVSYNYKVEYRKVGDAAWTKIERPKFTNGFSFIKLKMTYEADSLPAGQYEIRVVDLGGLGFLPKVDSAMAMGGAGHDVISGKCVSRYQRTYKIPLTGSAPWDIRVRRLSDDPPDTSVSNKTFFDALTECVDVKLSYNNTAAVMLSIDAENFQSIPTRGYEIYGIRIRVPSNYDPATRAYSGSWDGTFKIAWSDNPAWCFYDMLSNARYGLGEYIDADQIDKWTLYQIGRYCDELVPDGFGGTEPRFTCNLFLQTRDDAFKVVAAMASIFRGMAFWAAGQITATQDAPSDPVALFTSANVQEGIFTYQGADRRARHTVALVSWNDPSDMYRQKIEYIQDDDAIVRWGVIETETLAVGCTSRGQAHRVGKWLLFTEQNESETVTFRAGMDSARAAPGDVIAIQDSTRSGIRLGGRLMGATATSLTIDAPVTLDGNFTYQVNVVLPSGNIETRNVTNGPGPTSTLNLASALSEVPVYNAIWVVAVSNLEPEQWRIVSVSEASPAVVEITAMYHHPGKYAAVERDMVLEPVQSSAIPKRPGQPTGILAETQLFKLNDGTFSTRISIDWTAPAGAATHKVTWKHDDNNYKSDECDTPSYDIDNVPAGTYTIKIVSRNALGLSGPEVTFTHVVEASGISPDVTNLRTNPDFLGKDLPLIWDEVPGASEYELEIIDAQTDEVLRQEVAKAAAYTYSYAMNCQDGGPRRSLKVRARAKTLVGTSANWTEATFDNPAPAIPAGVLGEAGPGQASVMAERPQDQDLAGMIVWMHTTAAVPTTEENKVYQGVDNAFTKTELNPGIPMYFKLAFYDSFGVTGLNVSSSIMVTPTATGGITTVTELPANPESVGGELAVFLNVSDLDQRGLYGWNGTEWTSTSKILDGSVTGDKLAQGAVDYTKLALGAVQARNLAVKKHFLY